MTYWHFQAATKTLENQMTLYRTIKPKICPCGIKFTPRSSFQKFHDTKCELSHKNGTKKDGDLTSYSLSVLKGMARGVFQSWIKERDKGLPCISCGKKFGKGDVIHASHYFSAEGFTHLIFDEDNCHSSCDHCNIHLGGNQTEYALRLPDRIGHERVLSLANKGLLKVFTKLDKAEYIDIIKKYQR